MYKVLEKLRAGCIIEGKDKDICDQGLVGILRVLHGQIDRRFARPRTASVQPLLQSLAALGQAELGDDGRYAA